MTVPPISTIPPAARPLTAIAPAANAPTRRARASRPPPLRSRRAPYLFLLPYLLVTAVFFLYPLAYAAVLAFYQTSGPSTRVYVGIDNFRFLLSDPDFHRAVLNTVVFTVASLLVQLPLSLALALLLNTRRNRLKGFFRLAIFSPNLVGPAFAAIMFMMFFTPVFGLINRFLQALFGWGLEAQWLHDPSLVMPAIIITSLWMYVGFNMVYFLAALQNVDQSLLEAARIDGATPLGVFRHVTLPAIAPVTTFVVVTCTIGSFQLFELPYILLQGFGIKNSGMTIVGYLYNYAFENSGDLGLAAAVGWVLTLLILAVSLVQIRISSSMARDR
jgi:ABC-type sugar transport system permease subunit